MTVTIAEMFEAIDEAAIREFIRLGQEENLHLDFKTINKADFSITNDRRNFARCLSGFSNSSGGIVVWGIEASKNSQGIDCASAAVPILSIRLFLTRLNALTGDALSPIVDGIQHKVIEIGDDRGFAVTFAPECDGGPYMAKLGEDRYFKRSGDSFYRMEHYDLADMFGRRQKPHLNVVLKAASEERDRRLELADVELVNINLINSGRASAKHWGMFAVFENAEIDSVSDSLENVSQLNDGRQAISFQDDHGVIHPSKITRRVGHVRFRRLNPTANVVVRGSIYCENFMDEFVGTIDPVVP